MFCFKMFIKIKNILRKTKLYCFSQKKKDLLPETPKYFSFQLFVLLYLFVYNREFFFSIYYHLFDKNKCSGKNETFFGVFFYIFLFFLGSLLLPVLNFSLSLRKNKSEQNDAYECGFIEFLKSREFIKFDFYVPALMFIIFELELVIITPLLVNFFFYDQSQYILIFIWILIIIFGFIIEWCSGIMENLLFKKIK